MDLLTSAGKGHWCVRRNESVFAKGKGELTTFWLHMRSENSRSDFGSQSSESTFGHESFDEGQGEKERMMAELRSRRRERLVDWSTDILLKQLKEIVADRMAKEVAPDLFDTIKDLEMETLGRSGTAIEEVEDIISLKRFVARKKTVPAHAVELDEDVRSQLHDYVDTLSAMYHDNAFHNFEVRFISCLVRDGNERQKANLTVGICLIDAARFPCCCFGR